MDAAIFDWKQDVTRHGRANQRPVIVQSSSLSRPFGDAGKMQPTTKENPGRGWRVYDPARLVRWVRLPGIQTLLSFVFSFPFQYPGEGDRVLGGLLRVRLDLERDLIF